MIFSTAREVVKCGMGVFHQHEQIKEQARSATGAAWGGLFLLAVSAWLSQPLYYQYAANQHAASAEALGWIFAAIIAGLVFAFGADIARNIARYMKSKPVDNIGSISLVVVIWLGLAGFDVLVQYYGSEIRARESSGELITDINEPLEGAKVNSSRVEQAGNLTIIRGSLEPETLPALSPGIMAEYEALADVDFTRSWCGKHNTKHGNSYREAMTSNGGKWLFSCKDQQASFGKKYDDQRAGILARIEELKDLDTARKQREQKATDDKNAGILDIREATEMSFKFLTFALYFICLLFSVRVSMYLEDLQDIEAQTPTTRPAQNQPAKVDREAAPAQAGKPGLFDQVRGYFQQRKQRKNAPETMPEDQRKNAPEDQPETMQENTGLYSGDKIGFKQSAENAKNSPGNLKHTSKQTARTSFVGNQPFEWQDNTGKKYAGNATAKANIRKVKKAVEKLYQEKGEVPTITEVAKHTGLNRGTVSKYLSGLTITNTQTEENGTE